MYTYVYQTNQNDWLFIKYVMQGKWTFIHNFLIIMLLKNI